ncbi:MAG: tetratricopeptide repeat protein [Planctomycetaceae bacterium]|nr:tetratricopeptide repeat protein [Planctomycetaceae bacterium]
MFLPIILGALTPISLAPVRSEGGPGLQHPESPSVTAPGTTDPIHLLATIPIEPGKADRRAAAAAHVGRGIALATAGRTEAAIAAFRAALRLRPDDACAHYNLGLALAAGGQTEAAIAEYRAALRLRPDDAAAHVGLGIALATAGQTDAAIAEFRAALKLRPDDACAHYNLGTALAAAGRADAAVAAYRAALRLRPDDAAAYLGLGSALQRLGEHAEALVALRKAHALGAAKPGWPYPTAQWVREAERMAALDARPPDLRRGEDRPDDPEEVLLTRPHLQH